MKRLLSVIALLMIISLCACTPGKENADTGNAGAQITETDAEGITDPADDVSAELNAFEKASQALLEADRLHMDINISRKTEYGTDVIETTIVRKADYTAMGKDNFIAVIEDKNIIGKNVYNTTEVYSDGVEYLVISDDFTTGYYAESDAQSFMDRQVPVILFDPELYENVSVDKDNSNTVIFSSPTSLEDYVASDSIKMISAEASLTLTDIGLIDKMSYTLTYERGIAVITESYTSKVSSGASEASIYDVPVKESCLMVDDITVPGLMYYSAVSAQGLSALEADNTITVASEAGAVSKAQATTFAYYESDKIPFIGSEEIIITFSHEGETTQYLSSYRFEDGIATYTDDEGKTETVDMTADSFKESVCSATEVLVSFSSITAIEHCVVGDYLIVNYQLDDSVADYYKEFLCEHFYEDAAYLDSIAESYEKLQMSGFVTIDLDTLLPASEAYTYGGVHTINGQNYALAYSREVKLTPATEDAYVTLTGEVIPTDETESSPKPLFYQVTSPEGNKMYLLGTIHVGDGRTSHLPAEIYDALSVSDVLAVESNILDMEENLETDEQLITAISQSYYYLDGTKLADHISAENYEMAAEFAKAYGFAAYLDMLRPSVIASEIDNMNLSANRVFSAERGVDMLLSRLAKKQNKDIIEVETPEEHYGIYLKYSDAINEYLLETSMNTPRSEYLSDSAELYELWCEGDEAKLREFINIPEIPEDATDEEITLYNEYMDIILEERDTIMINKAKEYLSDERVEFVAVGLAHLISETGIVDALRAEGYTVELVEYK
ncbi:MAG: TraB/GumN family protein [Clostridia bacterium]|nr:TraB/GumN family protein [Clostridia bacterium]